jgi:catechol 2,3-dioxygenase-like lactoylglutathione lyase family enzyme
MSASSQGTRPGGRGLRRVELGCRDLDRSRDFYRGLLGFAEDPDHTPDGGLGPRRSATFTSGTVALHVVEVGEAGDLGGWANDDLQGGIRHVGMKVGDVDRQIRRLDAAGVTVLSHPADVLGDVRIAFFLDPDGARLEFIQGNLAYQHISSPGLAAAEAAQRLAADDAPRFDHVAMTVPDLPAALQFWCDRMGAEMIGVIRHHDDARGFLMTYLQAGPAVLEVFSFDVPVQVQEHPADDTALLGFRGVGLAVDPARAAAPAPSTLVGPAGVAVSVLVAS